MPQVKNKNSQGEKGGYRMFKVTFAFEDGSKVEAFANAGDNLLEVARGANVAIDAPCS